MSDGRIRVAHVITRMIVGGAQETVMLAAALADRSRFDSAIICGPQTGVEGSLHEEVRRRGVELIVVPDLVREVHPVRDLRVVPALVALFRQRRFDVVHTNSSKAGIVGRLAARRVGLPVVHTVHGWPFHDQQSQVVSTVWRTLERRTAPLAQRIVVVAVADREKGLSAGIGRPEQYRVVRSGVELEFYGPNPQVRRAVRAELGIPIDALVVGSVARLSPQKDPLTLVRAMAPVLSRRPDTRLLLVGDGPLRASVRRAVIDAGVASQVVQTGLRTDVPRLLTAMDVFAVSSLWEGLPRTLLQATAAGLPLAATDADGVRDIVEDLATGLLVPRGDSKALGLAIETLLAEPGTAARLASAASLLLPEFDARRMVQALEQLYVEAVA